MRTSFIQVSKMAGHERTRRTTSIMTCTSLSTWTNIGLVRISNTLETIPVSLGESALITRAVSEILNLSVRTVMVVRRCKRH